MKTEIAKHTPGPWVWRETIGGSKIRIVTNAYPETCIAYMAFPDSLQGIVDARLIAAAPELLAAAKQVAANATQDSHGILNRLIAAIAKAEGK